MGGFFRFMYKGYRKKYCISAEKEIHKMKHKAEKNKYFYDGYAQQST